MFTRSTQGVIIFLMQIKEELGLEMLLNCLCTPWFRVLGSSGLWGKQLSQCVFGGR